MENFDVVEGNLRAVKDYDGPGGKNMWNLYVKSVRGGWVSVQWLSVGRIQEFFQTKYL
jgi:hypothetical protein